MYCSYLAVARVKIRLFSGIMESESFHGILGIRMTSPPYLIKSRRFCWDTDTHHDSINTLNKNASNGKQDIEVKMF